MVSARWIAAALAALTIGVGGADRVAAQAPGGRLDAQPRELPESKFNPLVRRGAAPQPGAGAETAASKPPQSAPEGSGAAAAAVAIGSPAQPPASPVAVETVASTPAAGKTPLGLSTDAPETPPTIGVIGGGSGKGSGSVAPTPEPSTLLLMTAGLAGIYRLRRRR